MGISWPILPPAQSYALFVDAITPNIYCWLFWLFRSICRFLHQGFQGMQECSVLPPRFHCVVPMSTTLRINLSPRFLWRNLFDGRSASFIKRHSHCIHHVVGISEILCAVAFQNRTSRAIDKLLKEITNDHFVANGGTRLPFCLAA